MRPCNEPPRSQLVCKNRKHRVQAWRKGGGESRSIGGVPAHERRRRNCFLALVERIGIRLDVGRPTKWKQRSPRQITVRRGIEVAGKIASSPLKCLARDWLQATYGLRCYGGIRRNESVRTHDRVGSGPTREGSFILVFRESLVDRTEFSSSVGLPSGSETKVNEKERSSAASYPPF